MPDSPYRLFKCQKCGECNSFLYSFSYIDNKGKLFYECNFCNTIHSEKQCHIYFGSHTDIVDGIEHTYLSDGKFCCGIDYEEEMDKKDEELRKTGESYERCIKCNEYLYKLIDKKMTKIKK